MPAFDLLTIGHPKIPAVRFIGLLRRLLAEYCQKADHTADLFGAGQSGRLAAAYRRRARAVAYRAKADSTGVKPGSIGAKSAAETR